MAKRQAAVSLFEPEAEPGLFGAGGERGLPVDRFFEARHERDHELRRDYDRLLPRYRTEERLARSLASVGLALLLARLGSWLRRLAR